ncbi:MAG TPA: oligosaccharide flippase family protein [Rhodanobacteraceae bacterium]|jgi:O-antigen/teichoic acid export membrane protein|nr:oligosaccharide flippase family protein [Rhodanobacteraceae bacterium]
MSVEATDAVGARPERPHADFAAATRLLRRGASGALLVQVGGAAFALIVNVLLARLVGKSQYGIYAYAMSWVSVLGVLSLLGQSSSVVRLVPVYLHRREWGTLRGLRLGTSAIVLAGSIAVMLVGGLVVFALRNQMDSATLKTMLAAFLLLPLLTQLGLNGGFFRGYKRAISSGAYNSLVRPAFLIVLVLVLALPLGLRLDAPGIMLANVVAALAAVICSEWHLSRAWPAAAKDVKPHYEPRAWFKLGRQLFLLAAIGIVSNRVDVLILGALAGAKVVGPYYAAVRLAAIAAYGLTAVNTILAPMIAESYAAEDHATMARLVHHAAKLTFVVTAAVALAIAAAGYWALRLFGQGFAEAAYIPLLIILAGQCVAAMTGPTGFLMTMTRYERQASWFMALAAVLNVVFSVALIPIFGLTGAAIATALGAVAWNVTGLTFVRTRLHVNPTILPLPGKR